MNIGATDFIIDIELNLTTTILNSGKAGLTHYTFKYHTTRNFDMYFFSC